MKLLEKLFARECDPSVRFSWNHP